MNFPSRNNGTSSYAVASLICGILGWTLLPLLGSLGAIVCGHMARAELRRNPAKEGDGMATVGLVLGYASFLCSILAGIFILLFFGGFFTFMAHVWS